MLAPVTHILPLTTIRRARMLPSEGRVLVREEQKINATDVIAEGSNPGQHVILDVRRAFGLTKMEQLERAMEHRPGDRLQKGDIIAQTGGVFSKIMRAPADCTLMAVYGGQVLLEVEPSPVELRAGINGVVVKVIPNRGAIVETNGSLIQGVWGNDKISVGLLMVLADSPREEFTRARLDVSLRGAIALAGQCLQADSLVAASELPLRGLILASIDPELVSVAREMPFPVIVLDGFGNVPMNQAAFKLLSSNEKRDICLNAADWNPYTGIRPEVVIPLPTGAETARETSTFATGQNVRVNLPPYIGRVGTLARILPGNSMLPSGVLARAGVVDFGQDQYVMIPLADMDVLE